MRWHIKLKLSFEKLGICLRFHSVAASTQTLGFRQQAKGAKMGGNKSKTIYIYKKLLLQRHRRGRGDVEFQTTQSQISLHSENVPADHASQKDILLSIWYTPMVIVVIVVVVFVFSISNINVFWVNLSGHF